MLVGGRGVLECEEGVVAEGAVGCKPRWRRVRWGSLGQGSPSTTRAHIRLVQGQGRPRLAHCVHGSDSMPFDGPPASAYDWQPQHRRLSCDAISPSTSRLRFGQARDHLPAGGPHTDLDPVPVPQTRAIPIHPPAPSRKSQPHHRPTNLDLSSSSASSSSPPPHPPLPSAQWHATSLQQSSTSRGSEQQL